MRASPRRRLSASVSKTLDVVIQSKLGDVRTVQRSFERSTGLRVADLVLQKIAF